MSKFAKDILIIAKYADIFTDYGFKKIFEEEANKSFPIDFLNALLPEKAHKRPDFQKYRTITGDNKRTQGRL